MDYDQTTLAATFDAAHGYSPDVLRLWLKRVAAHAPPAPQVILDSCGTGRFTHPLTERFRGPRHRHRSVFAAEFAAGIAALRTHAAQHASGGGIIEHVHLFVTGV